jgi:hypothetical protein
MRRRFCLATSASARARPLQAGKRMGTKSIGLDKSSGMVCSAIARAAGGLRLTGMEARQKQRKCSDVHRVYIFRMRETAPRGWCMAWRLAEFFLLMRWRGHGVNLLRRSRCGLARDWHWGLCPEGTAARRFCICQSQMTFVLNTVI